MPSKDVSKPHASYDDWKGSVVTLHLSNNKILRKVLVLELWMTIAGPPLALQCKHGVQIINVPYEKVMYYTIHS